MSKNAQFLFTAPLPFWVRLPDGEYKGRWGANSYLLAIRSLSAHEDIPDNPSEGQVNIFPAIGRVQASGQVRIPGTLLRYTEVTVGFNMDVQDTGPTDQERYAARDWVRKFVNHFLDVYRLLARDMDVRPLSQTAFHAVQGDRGLQFKILTAEGGSSRRLLVGAMFDERNPVKLGPPLVDEGVVADVRQKVEEGKQPPLNALLLLDAEGYLLSGDTRLSVIDMNTALDVVVEQKVRSILRLEGKPIDSIDKQISPRTTLVIVNEYIKPRLVPGQALPDQWEQWRERYRLLRNRVVHDGYQPTRAEAEDSFSCVKYLCEYFASLGA